METNLVEKEGTPEKTEIPVAATSKNVVEQPGDPPGTEARKSAMSLLDSVRIGDSFDLTIKTTKKSGGIPVVKPKPGVFFRALDLSFDALSIREDDTGDIYVLSLDLAGMMAEEYMVRPRRFTVCVMSQGGFVVWPVSLPVDGQLDEYNKSALHIIEKAKESWVRVVANRSVGSYEIYVAEGDLGEPEKPSMSMEEIVAIAFKDRMIDSGDHPVLKHLRGEH